MTPCPCARAFFSEMVEEAMRRRPKNRGALWVLGWLLSHATDLPLVRQDGIMRELER